MGVFTTKKTVFMASILACSALLGECCQKPEINLGPAYLAPCNVKLDCGYDLFVTASYTLWQPIQENMKLGVSSDNTLGTDLVHGSIVDLNYKFKSGFKVGIGALFNYDNWDTFLQYTWFRGTEKVQIQLDSGNTHLGLYPAWQIGSFLNPEYNSGFESWKLALDLIDWDFGRGSYFSKELCIHPFMGMRLALIRQKVDVDYVNINPSYLFIWPSTFINQSSTSWAIGPRVGFNTSWNFCHGFHIFGGGEGDILFTQYHLSASQYSAEESASLYKIMQRGPIALRPHAMLDLGIGWDTYACSNRWHFELLLDYGFQVFFSQNMFQYLPSTTSPGFFSMPAGNLYIQGLTITGRFDF